MSYPNEPYLDLFRAASAPPILDSNYIFAYPATPSESSSKVDTKHSRTPSDIHELIEQIVDQGLEEDTESDPYAYYYSLPYVVPFMPNIHKDVFELSKDQAGCRYLQKKLDENNPFIFQSIFEQVIPKLPELMTDSFGNYLCQKLLKSADEAQVAIIIDRVAEQAFSICLSVHGTRAMQKLIEKASRTPHIDKLVTAIQSHVVELITDLNGNHVIQKLLYELTETQNEFIYQMTMENLVEIATHRHGCCVLQRCLDAATGQQKEVLVDCVIGHAVTLIQNAYGNYVVQYVLDLQVPCVNARLAQLFTAQVKDLARQKFASNVIEKCLELNSAEVQKNMIEEISRHIPVLLEDQYANYVVQRALQLSSPQVKEKILLRIAGCMEQLKKTAVGKRIYSKLVKQYHSLADLDFH